MSLEDLDSSKDTETTFAPLGRMKALFHLFIGLIIFIGSLLVFNVISVGVVSLFLNEGMLELLDMTKLMGALQGHPLLLKFFLFLSSSAPMIAAAFITMYALDATPKDYLLLHKPNKNKWFYFSLLFVGLSMPLMGFMLQLNECIDFSQWPEFHAWLLKQENLNNGLYESMIGDKTVVSFLASIILMAILPAVAEEMFFRGFLMNVLRGVFNNIHVAIFITSILFSVMHLQFMKFIPMIFLAGVFGYIAYWTGSIWTSIIAHFVNNSLAVIQLYFFTDGDYAKALEEGQNLPIALNAILAISVAFLFAYIQKNSTSKSSNFYV